MATKTTSGSGFLSIFAFSTLDLVDIAPKLKIFKGHFFGEIFWVKFSKIQKLFKRVTKTFRLRFFDIFWVLCPSIIVPNLVRIRWSFQGLTAGGVFRDSFFAPIFRPNSAVPCLTAYISGTKHPRWLKFQAVIARLEYNRPHPRHRPHRPPCWKGSPWNIGKNRNFRKQSWV